MFLTGRHHAPIPYLSFDQHLQKNLALFAFDQNPIGDSSCCHESDNALSKYQELFLRGFIVQVYICAYDFDIAEVQRIIDSVGWIYIFIHVRPFCPWVVRECISTNYYTVFGVFIREHHFEFDPNVYT